MIPSLSLLSPTYACEARYIRYLATFSAVYGDFIARVVIGYSITDSNRSVKLANGLTKNVTDKGIVTSRKWLPVISMGAYENAHKT